MRMDMLIANMVIPREWSKASLRDARETILRDQEGANFRDKVLPGFRDVFPASISRSMVQSRFAIIVTAAYN